MAVVVKDGARVLPQRKSRVRAAGLLGRHVEFDKRSAKYRVTKVLPIKPKQVASQATKVWTRPTGAFDQDGIGACTGDATEGVAATLPNRIARHRYDQRQAFRVYARATAIDPFEGTWAYPPMSGEDTGSSVLSAIKAGVELGLFAPDVEYRWVFNGSAELAATILTVGPAAVGVNWYEGFDRPNSQGIVQIAGGIRGGHAFEVLGYDPTKDEYLCINSWGLAWGVKGRFIVSGAVMDRLLHEDGEAVVICKAA